MRYTEQMENALFLQWDELDDYNEDFQILIESLNNEEFFRTFGDGLLFFLRKRQPDLTVETAVKYIEELCEKTGVSKNDIASANTLKSWFKGGPRPKKGEDSRSSMFALAFALQLTPDETAELFHKVYLDRAFDYRREREIIWYFCLQHKKTWTDAKRLIEKADGLDRLTDDHTKGTMQIKEDIDSLTDEAALISYIAKHGHNLAKKNVAAKKIVGDLIEKSKQTVEQETKLIELRKQAETTHKSKKLMYANSPEIEHFRNADAQSLNHIYEVITNCSVRGTKGTKTLFKNARLPKEIKNRFPEAGTLSKKDPTYEELRKLIILLTSYNYWYQVQTENVAVDIDDCIAEINAYLDDGGFSLMYYGNPYDWLFLYCALSDTPLDTFRGILAEVLTGE